MVLYHLSFLILFVPIAIGVNKTVSKVESAHNNTISAPKHLQKEDNSTKTEITLPIEGGNIVIPPPSPPVINENDGVLSKLPSEEFGEIPSKNKGHVVGRTGVPVIPDLKDITTKTPVILQKSTIKAKLMSTSTSVPPSPTPKQPHKPSVLKYEEASSIVSDKTSNTRISSAGASTTPANKPGSHPGMIMPIVITILIVPLFAVLGYMALKRGQEAWKNRHYKRMDFLLDGMYND